MYEEELVRGMSLEEHLNRLEQSQICLHPPLLPATYIKKIVHNMIFVTEVCFRFLVGQVPGLVKTFNVGIVPDTINVTNIKRCAMVILIELHQLRPLTVTLTIFQGHSNVKQFQLNISCSHLIKLKLCGITK